eukprot:SAG22_NODE_6797_length_810_cov_0.926864_1_plen_38_part_10
MIDAHSARGPCIWRGQPTAVGTLERREMGGVATALIRP